VEIIPFQATQVWLRGIIELANDIQVVVKAEILGVFQ
jgi:uncharacterized membrane protein